MDQSLFYIIIFGAGVFAQSVIISYKTFAKESWKYLACIAFALLAYFPYKHETVYSLTGHTLAAVLFFIIVFSMFFIKELLPVINEKILLALNLVVLYLVWPQLNPYWGLLFLVGTAATLYVSFTNNQIHRLFKLALYVWFMALNITIGVFQGLFIFNIYQGLLVSPYAVFFVGMSSLITVAYAEYIFELIPLPSKNESFAHRLARLKEHGATIISRYSDEQAKLRESVGIIIIIGGIIISNLFIGFFHPLELVSIILAFTANILKNPQV